MLAINSNINALGAQNALVANQRLLSASMERLATGVRINSAADDVAGLASSTRMTSEIRSLNIAVRNVHDGISMLQTAEGVLLEITNSLQRIRELAVQAANDTFSSENRAVIQREATEMISVIYQMVSATNFNGIKLLDGSFQSKNIQIGVGNTAGDQMSVSIANCDSAGLGLSGGYQTQSAGATVGSTALAAGELAINGTAIGVAASASAKDVATAINLQTPATGVTATAKSTVSTDTQWPYWHRRFRTKMKTS